MERRFFIYGCVSMIGGLCVSPNITHAQLDVEEMYGELMGAYARNYSKLLGYEISDQNVSDISRAFRRNYRDSLSAQITGAHVRRGKEAVETLINEMIGSILSRGGGPGDTLGERTFADALKVLCPLCI